jgi:hypothetical protein
MVVFIQAYKYECDLLDFELFSKYVNFGPKACVAVAVAAEAFSSAHSRHSGRQ